MSVHQTKDGRYFVKYYIINPKTGKKNKTKKEYFGRGKEAEIKAYERDGVLKSQGEINPYKAGITKPSEPTFLDLAHEYLNSKQNNISKISFIILKWIWIMLPGSWVILR